MILVRLSRTRAKEIEDLATSYEISLYSRLSGPFMYIGSTFTPQSSMVTSKIKQQFGDLSTNKIVCGNASVRYIINRIPYIRYFITTCVNISRIVSLSDATHGGGASIYGQTGVICGLLFEGTGSN